MHRDLVPLLACPRCRAELRLAEWTEEEENLVTEGSLVCVACGAAYPITDGVARLLVDSGPRVAQRTRAHFSYEFNVLSSDDRDLADFKTNEFYFASRSGLDPDLRLQRSPKATRPAEHSPSEQREADLSYLEGKFVLDAGCGPGRFTRVAAASASRVVGLDFGDHVDRAARYCAERGIDNVDFVQGSVLSPPFQPRAFDYVFTIGVLHHTPDPELGARQLAELVAPGGGMSIWVYSSGYWNDPIRRFTGRLIHAILSRLAPPVSFAVCRYLLYPWGRLQMKLAERSWTKFLFAPLFAVNIPRDPQREVMLSTIYDYYGPAIITTHDYDEVRSWIDDAGFQKLIQVPVPTAWLALERDPNRDDR